ncbi:hypothetical protein, partial [Enterocloster bolteae]|uniref:hypothetical protein n=1 Tax=Enterocloster bolteae TaxID=208479 RepID=UPI0021092E3B
VFVKAVPPPKITGTDNLPGAPDWSVRRWPHPKESAPHSSEKAAKENAARAPKEKPTKAAER